MEQVQKYVCKIAGSGVSGGSDDKFNSMRQLRENIRITFYE